MTPFRIDRLVIYIHLTSGISAVRKDSLARDPLALRHKEPDERSNILDLCKSVAHALALVESHRLV